MAEATPPSALRPRWPPPDHTDPFDRMLIAQAQREGFTLVTVDSRFSDYDVELLPLG
jgi:PIN domain nuclease of toxin-antitoxin system